MNEKEVKTLEEEVGSPSPEYQKQWARKIIEVQKQEEQRLQSEWHMWKYTRSDEKMRAVKQALDETRSTIEHLRSILGEEAPKSVNASDEVPTAAPTEVPEPEPAGA